MSDSFERINTEVQEIRNLLEPMGQKMKDLEEEIAKARVSIGDTIERVESNARKIADRQRKFAEDLKKDKERRSKSRK